MGQQALRPLPLQSDPTDPRTVLNPQRLLPLPPELIHMVLDHLGDDKLSLSACSQVCRSWLLLGREHLFRSVSLYISEGLDDYHPFIQFLLSDAVTSFIKHLTLAHVDADYKYDLETSTLLHILAMLPHLHQLTLCNLRVYSEAGNMALTPDEYPRIKALRLENMSDAPDDMGSLLSLFVHVPTLHLSSQHLLSFEPSTPFTKLHPRELVLDLCFQPSVFYLTLMGVLGFDVLQSLSLRTNDASAAGELILKVGRRLKHLELRFDHPTISNPPTREIAHFVSLKGCTSLVSLSLWVSVWAGGRAWGSIDALFPRLPPNIRTIDVNIPFGCPEFRPQHLYLLSSQISNKIEEGVEKAESLHSVTFFITDSTKVLGNNLDMKKAVYMGLRRLVEERFPRSVERGIISFRSNVSGSW